MTDKRFNGIVSYLKVATLIGAFACLISICFVGIDPWHSLDSLIWTDLYGTPELPEIAKPAFELPFLLFSWLSLLTMLLIFLVTKHALPKKEAWAYWVVILIGVCWPCGAAIITYYTQAWSYFISVGMMTLLFFPAVVLLFPYFRKS